MGMNKRVVFRGLRQVFVISGLLTILIYCAYQSDTSIETRDIASQQAAADFKSTCISLAKIRGFKAEICDTVQKKFFSTIPPDKALAEFLPKDVGAPSQKIDSKIRFVVFNDASGSSALSYCYFAFKGTIDSAQIQPIDLNLASSGYSISSQDMGAYQNWIETTDTGKKCKILVEQQTGYALPNVEKELKGNLSLIAINPLAALNGGFVDMKSLLREMSLSVNHGRVIAYMQKCPAVEAWGQKQWLSMSEDDRKVIKSKLTAYKWDDDQVAGRQYAAFAFENNPAQVLSLTKGCEI
jgi:hypothetical protein